MIQRKSKDIMIWMFSNKTVVKNLHNTSEKRKLLISYFNVAISSLSLDEIKEEKLYLHQRR